MIGPSKSLKDVISFSLKEKIIFLMMITYDETSLECFTIMKQQVILVNSKHIMPYASIIGGLDCVHMSKIMYMVADLANSSRSIDNHLNPCISLLKELIPHDLSQTAPWISSPTYHLSTVLILFWSW